MFKKLSKFIHPTFKKAEEAKAAKLKNIPFLIASLIVLITVNVIPNVIGGETGALLSIIMIPVMIVAFIFTLIFFLRMIFLISEQQRLNQCTCKCGTRFIYPENVTYELGNTAQRSTTTKNDGIIRKTSQDVHLTCTCPKCGTVKTFTRGVTIKSEELSSMGTVLSTKNYNIDDWLFDFFSI